MSSRIGNSSSINKSILIEMRSLRREMHIKNQEIAKLNQKITESNTPKSAETSNWKEYDPSPSSVRNPLAEGGDMKRLLNII